MPPAPEQAASTPAEGMIKYPTPGVPALLFTAC